jgi:hypothetical protein
MILAMDPAQALAQVDRQRTTDTGNVEAVDWLQHPTIRRRRTSTAMRLAAEPQWQGPSEDEAEDPTP